MEPKTDDDYVLEDMPGLQKCSRDNNSSDEDINLEPTKTKTNKNPMSINRGEVDSKVILSSRMSTVGWVEQQTQVIPLSKIYKQELPLKSPKQHKETQQQKHNSRWLKKK